MPDPRSVEVGLKQFYLLRDFLVCAHCDSYFSGRLYRKQYRAVYYCPRHERLRDDPYSKNLKHCEQNAYLRIEETDDLVWNTVVDVLSTSHRYKEEIKLLTINAKGPQRDRKQEIAMLTKRLKAIGAERRRIETMLGTVEAGNLIAPDSENRFQGVIQTLKKEVDDLQGERVAMEKRIKDLENVSRWTDWMAEFGTKITELRQLTGEKRKDFLKGVVDTIRVTKTAPTQVQLEILFKQPFVEDLLVKSSDPGDRRKYKIEDGKSSIRIPLVLGGPRTKELSVPT